LVQEAAKGKVPTNTTALRESILTDVVVTGNTVTGVCYPTFKYAIYVEFGTGPRGQTNHEGISPDVAVAYTQSPWWIHESQLDEGVAEKYHWEYIETKQGKFYKCTGQPAHPFMYPALKNNEYIIRDIYKEHIDRILGEQ
jgi:HK97 gp10 family phage protein